jgi:hypothetical protein
VCPRRFASTGASGFVRAVRLLATAALLAIAATPALGAVTPTPEPTPARSQVVPGIDYERRALGGDQTVHVVRARRSARIRLDAITAGPTVLSRGSLASAVRSRLSDGVVAAVNGDFFNLDTGHPSGVLLRGSRIESDPEPQRSALIVPPPTGRIDLARLTLEASWQPVAVPPATAPAPRTIQAVNRPRVRSSETILFTPAAGAETPDGDSLFEARVRLDDPAPILSGTTRQGTVVARGGGGGMPIEDGHVVLTGVGSAGSRIAAELPLGTRVAVTTLLGGLPEGATDAVGGGPALVDDGRVIQRSSESFSLAQLSGRTSRTAVGQTADGTILLVAADGPVQGSRGITAAELAVLMGSLGATDAVAMDAGGSTQMQIGTRSTVGWTSPRPISTALALGYSGVQLQPLPRRLTPNGDGVTERVSAIVRSPSAGVATVTARRRGGGAVRLGEVRVGPGAARVNLDPRRKRMRDGVWDVRARFVPDGGARPTAQTRRVLVDRTLGRLSATRVVRTVGGDRRRLIRIGFRLSRDARVTVRAVTSKGTETIVSGRRLGRGQRVILWDRTVDGDEVGGTARIEVIALGKLGRTGLTRPVKLPPAK